MYAEISIIKTYLFPMILWKLANIWKCKVLKIVFYSRGFYFRDIRKDNQVVNIKSHKHVCWRYFTHISGLSWI